MRKFFALPGHQSAFLKWEAPTEDGGSGTPSQGETADTDSGTEAEEGSAKENRIPQSRFNEVNSELKAWKEIGKEYGLSPAEVRQVLGDYATILEQAQKEKPAAKETKPAAKGGLSDEQRQQALERLESVIPGISKLPDLVQSLHGKQQELSERDISKNRQEASRLVSGLAKQHGYIGDEEKDAGTLKYIEDMVASRVYSNRKDAAAFESGDFEVVKRAFDAVEKEFLSQRVAKVKQTTPRPFPSLLSGSRGLGVDGAKSTQLTAEQLAKLPPRQRSQKTHDGAWETMKAVADAKEAERQLYGG